VQLLGDPAQPRMRGVSDARADYTVRMLQFGASVGLRISHISGYLFKSRSPSCGVWDTPIVATNGGVHAYGAGLFTQSIVAHDSNLPVQDERALRTPELRDQFFEQVFSYRRWRQQVEPDPTIATLQDFHVAHKYSVLAHHQQSYRTLGQMLASASLSAEFIKRYAVLFFSTLRTPTTRASHVNVLQHVLGYFKKSASVVERRRVISLIEHYRSGALELNAVLQALRTLNEHYPNAYLLKQIYLYPEKDEVLLRASATAGHLSESAL